MFVLNIHCDLIWTSSVAVFEAAIQV